MVLFVKQTVTQVEAGNILNMIYFLALSKLHVTCVDSVDTVEKQPFA